MRLFSCVNVFEGQHPGYLGNLAVYVILQVRQEIQKAKLELMCELQRLPTVEEIISRVGISPERYYDVMKASKSVYSLNSRHVVTQEEFINAITDIDGVGGDKRRQPALLRLALDDVVHTFNTSHYIYID